jgi:hypothetical protein
MDKRKFIIDKYVDKGKEWVEKKGNENEKNIKKGKLVIKI